MTMDIDGQRARSTPDHDRGCAVGIGCCRQRAGHKLRPDDWSLPFIRRDKRARLFLAAVIPRLERSLAKGATIPQMISFYSSHHSRLYIVHAVPRTRP